MSQGERERENIKRRSNTSNKQSVSQSVSHSLLIDVVNNSTARHGCH